MYDKIEWDYRWKLLILSDYPIVTHIHVRLYVYGNTLCIMNQGYRLVVKLSLFLVDQVAEIADWQLCFNTYVK